MNDMLAIARAGQDTAGSWTLSAVDAQWVAEEASRRRDEPLDAVSHDLHKRVWDRRGLYPSAVEVSAICRAVFAVIPPLSPPAERRRW